MLEVTLRRLEVFVAVVDTGRFGAAAASLNIAQPSVSAHIKALESKVGSALFDRSPGTAPSLTDTGKAVYDYARETLARAHAVSNDLSTRKRQVRFAAQRFVATSLLTRPLENFSNQYPDVELIARTGTFEEVHGLYTSGAVDLVFMLSPGQVPGLSTVPLGRYRLAFLAAPDHPLAGKAQIEPATLAEHPFISAYRTSYFGRTLETMLRDAGVPPLTIRSQAQEMGMLREMVLAGMGISFSLRRSVSKDLADGTLVELDVNLPPMHLALSYARNPMAHSVEIDSLVALIQQSEHQVV